MNLKYKLVKIAFSQYSIYLYFMIEIDDLNNFYNKCLQFSIGMSNRANFFKQRCHYSSDVKFFEKKSKGGSQSLEKIYRF